MTSLFNFKIPVIPGINDTPLAPDAGGNGRGCNGSYYIDKYHGLIDELVQRELNHDVRTSNFTAEAFTIYEVNGSGVAVTLPAADNNSLLFFVVNGSTTLTSASGQTVNGAATLNVTDNKIGLVYDVDNTNWVVFIETGVSGGGGESYRIINGTSEAGFYTPGGSLDFTIGGVDFGTITTDKIILGSGAGASITTAERSIAIGDLALASVTDAYSNIAIGNSTLSLNQEGENNIAIGDEALANATYSSNTVAIGNLAMHQYGTNLTGNWTGDNVAIGNLAMRYVQAGTGCTAVGAYALQRGSDLFSMTAVGWSALANATTANSCTAMGDGSLIYVTTGFNNSAFGSGAGTNVTTGSDNSFLGSQCGQWSGTTSNDCVYIGSECPDRLTSIVVPNAGYRNGLFTGNSNIYIGSHCGYDTPNGGASDLEVTGSNNIVIGSFAHVSSRTVSNEITLGDSSITSLRCAATSITSLSDRRDKTNIVDIPVGLDFVNALHPVKFTWDCRDGAKVGQEAAGFIAQDLQAAQQGNEYLDLVLANNPDKLEAAPGNLIPVLVKAIQELTARVQQLEAQQSNG